MSMEAMRLAGQQMGLNEVQQNAALQEYMANGGVNLDPAVTAWCAAFVNASLSQAGLEGTGSNMARSFENWGNPVTTPQQGDIAVFHRDGIDSGYGHVGFFQGYDDAGNILVLGGNQGNSVSVAPYSADQLLGFRRAGDAPTGPQNALAGGYRPQGGMTPQRNALALMEALRPPQMQSNALNAMDFMTQPQNVPLIPIMGA